VAQQTGPNALWDKTLPLSQTTVPKLPNRYRNFGPVLGFAWTPRILEGLFGNSKTVIRGGFRIAYDFAYYNLATNVEEARLSQTWQPFLRGSRTSRPSTVRMSLPRFSSSA
jgi:hypothetical protein